MYTDFQNKSEGVLHCHRRQPNSVLQRSSSKKKRKTLNSRSSQFASASPHDIILHSHRSQLSSTHLASFNTLQSTAFLFSFCKEYSQQSIAASDPHESHFPFFDLRITPNHTSTDLSPATRILHDNSASIALEKRRRKRP